MESTTQRQPARPDPPLLIRVDEAARLTQMGRSTLHKMIAAGELPCVRFGRAVRIRRADLEQWISERATA